MMRLPGGVPHYKLVLVVRDHPIERPRDLAYALHATWLGAWIDGAVTMFLDLVCGNSPTTLYFRIDPF